MSCRLSLSYFKYILIAAVQQPLHVLWHLLPHATGMEFYPPVVCRTMPQWDTTTHSWAQRLRTDWTDSLRVVNTIY